MAVVKKSNIELQLFLKNVGNFIRENANHVFIEKLNKQVKKLRDINDNYQEDIRDAAIEFCEVNEKGIITYDDKGNFMFNKENMKKYNAKTKEIGKKLISFELVITKDQVSKLQGDYKFYFQDFIETE